jgi:hypothetical protein
MTLEDISGDHTEVSRLGKDSSEADGGKIA